MRKWGNFIFPDLGLGQTDQARLLNRRETAGAAELDLMPQGGSGVSEGQELGTWALKGSRR